MRMSKTLVAVVLMFALGVPVHPQNLDHAPLEERSLRAHQGVVSSLAFSANGQTLVTAGSDRAVYVWDVESGQRLKKLEHFYAVSAVAVSATGNLVATGGNATLRIWNLEVDSPPIEYQEFSGTLTALAFHPGGEEVAAANTNRTVGLWNLKTGVRRDLAAHSEAVQAVAYSPDGLHLVSGGDDGNALLWDVSLPKPRVLRTFRVGAPITSIAIDKSGGTLAVASNDRDKSVTLWDLNSSSSPQTQPLQTLKHNAGVKAVAFSLDGTRLVTGTMGLDRKLTVWNLSQTPPEVLRVVPSPASINALAWSADERFLAVGRNSVDERQNASLFSLENSGLNAVVQDPISGPTPGIPPANTDARLFVLGVGVEVFDDPNVRSLNYTVDDVVELATFFEKQQGKGVYRRVISRILLNHDASQARVRESMNEIALSATDRDTVLVFFSSHGENIGGDYYFMTADARATNAQSIQETGLPGQTLLQFIAQFKGKAVLFLDTCHSGQISVGLQNTNPSDFLARSSLVLAANSLGGLKVIAAASGGGQFSNEGRGLTNGFYSYALLEGLQGKARPYPDKSIGIRDLLEYVRTRVPEIVRQRSGAAIQEPTFSTVQDNWPVAR